MTADKRRRAISRWIGRNWARISYSHFVEPVWLEANRHDLAIADLDPRLDGLKILHLTDFHLGRSVPESHIRSAVEQGRRENCDLVALTGDFVHAGFKHVEAIAELLGRLRAPLGVFAVLGNHDYSVRNVLGKRRYPKLPDAVAAALRSVGVDVLNNCHRLVEYRQAPLAICGVADLWSRESDMDATLAEIPENVPRVVLAHNPRSLEQVGSRRCDLMLSGHTHGGQVDLPRIGRPLLGKRMKRFAAGLYTFSNLTQSAEPFGPWPSTEAPEFLPADLNHDVRGYLYVNKGIGFTVRLRFMVRPEIAILTLRRGKMNAL